MHVAIFPSQRVPIGLGCGKRQEHISIFLSWVSKSIICDITCSDMFCGAKLLKAVANPGIVIWQAEEHKLLRIETFPDRFLFVPIAFEISRVLGPWIVFLLC